MEDAELLRARIRLALYLTALATAVSAAADMALSAPPGTKAIKAGGLTAVGLALVTVKRVRAQRGLTFLALAAIAATLAVVAGSGAWDGQPEEVQVLAPAVCIAAASLFSWGWRLQSAVVAMALAAIGGSLHAVGAPFDSSTAAALAGCLASLPIAGELERRRPGAAVVQREEEAAARLANAAAQIELQHEQPESLLHRGCQLAIETLQADAGRVFMIEGDDVVQRASCGCGDALTNGGAEKHLRRQSIAGLVARLEREGAVCLTMADGAEFRAAPPQLKHEIGMAIYFPLRRRGQIIGIQSVEYRRRDDEDRGIRLRLARGLSHLMSLAVENARLACALEAADQINTDFLASVSHELRTPLNVIIGYNDLLLEGAFDPLSSEQKRTLERVQGSARELLELLSITLELSRDADRGQQLRLQEVRAEAVVDELIEEMRALMRKPGVRLQWSPPAAALPPLWTDRRRLKMILKNLIENAIKFTDRGRVTVEAQAEKGGVVLRVSDTGVGIARQEIESIFERFQRGKRTPLQGRGGVGLGLYIVKQLLKGLGGKIEVDSAPGQGSAFSVWIPSRPGAAQATPPQSLARAG